MSIESSLINVLEGHAGLTALVSTRIYPDQLPDNPTLPAVVYQRVATMHDKASGKVPLRRVRFQIDVWSDRRLDTVNVGAQLHDVIDMQSASGIVAMFPEDDHDEFDADARLYRRRIDIYAWEHT